MSIVVLHIVSSSSSSSTNMLLNVSSLLLTLAVAGTSNEFVQDSTAIASSIKYHAEFTTYFSPEKFDPKKAFFATAESVRDSLIINWNATYEYYERINVKQAYYMSMEYLQVYIEFSF